MGTYRRHLIAIGIAVAGCLATSAGSPVPAAAAPADSAGTEHPAPCNQTPSDADGKLRAQCFAVLQTEAGRQLSAAAAEPPATALGPAEIRSAYELPDTGADQTVAIVDAYGYSSAEADLTAFRSHYGLPECTTANGCFRKVDQAGGTDYPPNDTGWAMETALDLDAVSAACPKCHLLLVEGDDNGIDSLGQAVDTAVALGAKFVSNSYGVAPEDPAELDYDHYYDHPGVVVAASSGDVGNITGWPAAAPNVVGVGGTTLTRDGSTARGWSETAWADAGSGCSPYEPRPVFQQSLGTACDGRAIADISADADPATGLAVYDTLGYGGWLQVGGTSLAAPLVTAMYALAGPPEPGSYPVTYPYAAPQGLNDVTLGVNGSCGNVLCTAGTGWDGPTGLGTPHGVQSLAPGSFGHVTGVVTDAATRQPVAGASVSTGDGFAATSDASGHFDLAVPAGGHDVTVTDFGYRAQTRTGLTVTDGGSTTADFALEPLPTATVSGRVTDGGGQGWPLYARITIDGYPRGAIFTDPETGRYHVTLPTDASYTMTITPEYGGYLPVTDTITLAGSDLARDVSVPVEEAGCTAAGYGYTYDGAGATFETGQAPDGWTVVDNQGNGQVWRFDDPGHRTNRTGGTGGFAIIDSYYYRNANNYQAAPQDTSLVSPVADLSGQDNPTISFDQDFDKAWYNVGDVDLSLDGGATWQTVLHQDQYIRAPNHQSIPIPQAANQPDVRVRFHYTSTADGWYSWWGIDNVIVGVRNCSSMGGGLVVGQVRDRNTGQPVERATITSVDHPADQARSTATADDAALRDGFYWMYSALTGKHPLGAAASEYSTQTQSVNVRPGMATAADFSLAAGRLTVKPGSVDEKVGLGKTKKQKITITNTGTAATTIRLTKSDGNYRLAGGADASEPDVVHVAGDYSPLAVDPTSLGGSTPDEQPWTNLATYPTKIMDNAVDEQDGVIYSVGGVDGYTTTAASYRYDPATSTWTRIADLPVGRENAAAAFIDGRLYVTGGWDPTLHTMASTVVYDPATDTWSAAASGPFSAAAAGRAVLDGKLYLVGGCTNTCGYPNVRRYDPATDSWQVLAPYPIDTAHLACGAINGKLYCAGGTARGVDRSAAYVYDPAGDTWSRLADMPVPLWGMGYTAANDELIVSGGIGNGTLTNAGYAYDPATDAWSDLPAANSITYRGGSACGLDRIGGSTSSGFHPSGVAETLPGYWACGESGTPWLTLDRDAVTLEPGDRIVVTAQLAANTGQPGSYSADVWIKERTPYAVPPVDVTMRVDAHGHD